MPDSSVYQFFEIPVEVAMGVGKNEWSCGYQGGFGGERIARRIRKATYTCRGQWASQGHGQEERSRPTLVWKTPQKFHTQHLHEDQLF